MYVRDCWFPGAVILPSRRWVSSRSSVISCERASLRAWSSRRRGMALSTFSVATFLRNKAGFYLIKVLNWDGDVLQAVLIRDPRRFPHHVLAPVPPNILASARPNFPVATQLHRTFPFHRQQFGPRRGATGAGRSPSLLALSEAFVCLVSFQQVLHLRTTSKLRCCKSGGYIFMLIPWFLLNRENTSNI